MVGHMKATPSAHHLAAQFHRAVEQVCELVKHFADFAGRISSSEHADDHFIKRRTVFSGRGMQWVACFNAIN
jgi:hypothetical protein